MRSKKGFGMTLGFIHPTKAEEEYGFVTKEGNAYIGVRVNKPYNTRNWRDMYIWSSKEKALGYQEKFGGKDWVLTKVVGLMLDFDPK